MAKTRHSSSSPTPTKKKMKETPHEADNTAAVASNAPIQHICRTCLEEIQASSLIPLNDSSSNIRNELRACIPEVNCDLIPNSGICTSCSDALHKAFQFKQKCLQTEERIRRQLHKICPIDLNKIKVSHGVILPNASGLGLDMVLINHEGVNNADEPLQMQVQPSKNSSKTPEVSVTTEKCFNVAGNVNSEKTHTALACKHCDFTSDNTKQFIIHLKGHPRNKYVCPLCDYKTPYSRILAIHLKNRKKHPELYVEDCLNAVSHGLSNHTPVEDSGQPSGN